MGKLISCGVVVRLCVCFCVRGKIGKVERERERGREGEREGRERERERERCVDVCE